MTSAEILLAESIVQVMCKSYVRWKPNTVCNLSEVLATAGDIIKKRQKFGSQLPADTERIATRGFNCPQLWNVSQVYTTSS